MPTHQQGSPWDLFQGPFLWSSLCGSKLLPHFSCESGGKCLIAPAPLLGALMMGQFTEMWFGTRQDLFLVFSQPVPGGRWVPREGAVRAGPMSPGGVAAGHSQEHTWQEATCVLWPSDLPCVLAMLATFTRYLALLSPALTPARGHQSPPGERDGVLFPSSLLPSG